MKIKNIFSGLSVLIIDSDILNFLVLSALLDETGITVLHAESSSEAVDFFDLDTPVDFIISDVNPDNLKAIKYIQNKQPDIPVFLQKQISNKNLLIPEQILYNQIFTGTPAKDDFILMITNHLKTSNHYTDNVNTQNKKNLVSVEYTNIK
ncbi:MAG: hypothetical protein Kow0068_08010 [Marinilabiliales bacterium]